MEFVYVVKRGDLFERRFPHGLELLGPDEVAGVLGRIRDHGFFVERRHAEIDPSMKQIIPYCVVTRGERVFLMRRLETGAESRLRGKRSIGVGGHINPVDGTTAVDDVVEAGMRRELEEEVVIDGPWYGHLVGLLNDDSTEVGSVHLGLVYTVDATGDVRVRETEHLEGSFADAAEVRELCTSDRDSFESWSALVIDRLDAIRARGTSGSG